jgi:hypothetical protein
METIRRNLALADMDIRTDERGRRRIFSIKFVSKEGKVYFMPQAYACGAGRMNMKEYQLRGVQPCDCKGNPEGHPYPVDIWGIERSGFFNGREKWAKGFENQRV